VLQQETSKISLYTLSFFKCRSTGESGDFGTGFYRERDFCKEKYQFLISNSTPKSVLFLLW